MYTDTCPVLIIRTVSPLLTSQILTVSPSEDLLLTGITDNIVLSLCPVDFATTFPVLTSPISS